MIDSDISCFVNSPDEKYQAVGGLGVVYVFDRNMYWAKFTYLDTMVVQLMFIKLHDEYLLICRDQDYNIKIYCMKERIHLQTAVGIKGDSFTYNELKEKLYVQRADGNIVEYEINLSKELCEELFDYKSVEFAFLRYWLETGEEACLKHMDSLDRLILNKINVFTITLATSYQETLKQAVKYHDSQMM